MATSPSTSVQQARQALADRLSEIREGAGLSMRAMAAAMGRHESKVNRIEHGRQVPSTADLRVWCSTCGAEDQLGELVSMARAVDLMYEEWQRAHRAGLRQVQDSYVPLYERTRRFRIYESSVIPGFFQTPAYARALLSGITSLRNLPDDVDDAVAARMARSRFLHGGRTFAVLIEESVLRSLLADTDVMAAQLGHLLIAMTMPSVSLGIIPLGAPARHRWISESFAMHDDEMVEVELLSARVRVTQRAEIEIYGQAFTDLAKLAVHGAEARRIISAAIDALG